ncbi:MAG TPA: enoyl-CoA hydratase/isomerase family protein, partial [Spongiibacteraceae bacterium]
FLLVNLQNDSIALNHEEQQRIHSWLQQLPCPSIAIGVKHSLLSAFDVVVSATHDLNVLIAQIESKPIAAMTLVQVLRTTMTVPAVQALHLESLAYATLQGGPEFRDWSSANPPKSAVITDPGPPLLVERTDNDLHVRLNRPSRRNAISVEMRDALTEVFQLIATDPSLQHISISGNGACFSVGGDVDEFGVASDSASAHVIRSIRLPAKYLLPCADRVTFHVHSACIGAGIEIPAFGRHISAARNAFFQLPEIRFGLIPGAGGCVSIPRRIGRQRTAYMALTAKKINATTALDWGLIDAIVD